MNGRDSVPDESVAYVREMEIVDDAEDVKRVRFIGDTTTVEVGITDEVMIEFVEIAEEVFDEIHADMAEMREIFDQTRGDSIQEDDWS
ncbi:hypothetical protein AB7C87_01890 [Natrarchaeobius sp. A-rgal3]|uniref:hypothetical protein n=1 Tax=Natrarchaeobius versutus TaxID=1679078 RepID=UPI00350ED62E